MPDIYLNLEYFNIILHYLINTVPNCQLLKIIAFLYSIVPAFHFRDALNFKSYGQHIAWNILKTSLNLLYFAKKSYINMNSGTRFVVCKYAFYVENTFKLKLFLKVIQGFKCSGFRIEQPSPSESIISFQIMIRDDYHENVQLENQG